MTPRAFRIAAAVLLFFGLAPLPLWAVGFNPEWYPELVRYWLTWGCGAVVAAVLIAAVAGNRVDQGKEAIRDWLLAPSDRVFVAACALGAMVASSLVAWYCFNGQAISGDELSQLFQAHLLTAGRLFAHSPQPREFFSDPENIDAAGKWFSQFPMGGPVLIAVGVAARAAWLVNPLLTAWTTRNLYRFSQRAFDEVIARVATLIFIASPFVFLMGATEMNHVGALAFMSFALAELPRWTSSESAAQVRRAAVAIGLGLGVAATIRPYDAALISAIVLAVQVPFLARDSARRRALLWQIGAGAIPVCLLLIANAQTTGSPWLFGYTLLNGADHNPGFHRSPFGNQHSPLRGLQYISIYLLRLDSGFADWPIPAVAIIAFALIRARRVSEWDSTLLAILLVMLIGYAAYWFEGYAVGEPRYLYSALPALVIFYAQALRAFGRFRSTFASRAALMVIPLCTLVAWGRPPKRGAERAIGIWSRVTLLRDGPAKYKTDLAGAIARAHLDHALVFVNDGWYARLRARLVALGARPLMAGALLDVADGCVLQQALDEEAFLPATSNAARLERVLAQISAPPDPVTIGMSGELGVTVARSRPLPSSCAKELIADKAGTSPFGAFLAYEHFDEHGDLGGPVVFARDMGARNEVLRPFFKGRAWYLYRPPGDGAAAAFIPYPQPSATSAAPAPPR